MNKDMKVMIEAKDGKIKILERERQEQMEYITELEQLLIRERADKEKLQEALTQSERECEELKDEILPKLDELERNQQRRDLTETSNLLKMYQKKSKDMEQEAENWKKQANDWEQLQAKAKKNADSWRQLYEQEKRRADSLKAEQPTETEKMIISTLTKQLQELETKSNEREQLIEELMNTLEELDPVLTDYEDSLTNMQNRSDEREKLLKDWVPKLETLQRQCRKTQTDLDSLEPYLKELEAELYS